MTEVQPPSFQQDTCVTAEQDRLLWESVVCTEGVADVAGGELLVSQASSTSVAVAAGSAFVEGNTPPGAAGMYWVHNTSPVTLVVTNTGAIHTEAVVAVVKDNQYDTSGVNVWALEILEPYNPVAGYPAGPQPNTAHSGLIILATVTVNAAGAITGLTDTRTQAEFCEPMIPAGSTPSMIAYTSNGTFTKGLFPGLKAVRARLVGGGGGGGASHDTAAGQNSEGAGGGGGGYVEAVIPVGSLAASEPVVCGTGGAGGVDNISNGAAGGTSTFAGLSATGGGGGTNMGATSGDSVVDAGNGGVGSGGTVNSVGDDGGHGVVLSGNRSRRNFGGGTPLGGLRKPATGTFTGIAGAAYGGGGSGGNSGGNLSGRNGGPGANGAVFIELIY